MFEQIERIFEKPKPFEFYTAADLWTEEHTAQQMLSYHLNPDIDASSRNFAFLDKSADWIAKHFSLHADSSVADFGCGPGLYASRLAAKGIKVTGIDFSANSLRYGKEQAEKAGHDIDYVHTNYLEFASNERFDAVIMIMCDFCVLSPEQRSVMLKKFKGLLKPGGSILLDVNSLASFDAKQEGSTCEINQLFGFWSKDKYYGFVNNFKYDDVKVSLDKYTIIEKERTRTVYNWFQHFSPESLTKEFEAAGLKITEQYGDVAGSEYEPEGMEFAVVAVPA